VVEPLIFFEASGPLGVEPVEGNRGRRRSTGGLVGAGKLTSRGQRRTIEKNSCTAIFFEGLNVRMLLIINIRKKRASTYPTMFMIMSMLAQKRQNLRLCFQWDRMRPRAIFPRIGAEPTMCMTAKELVSRTENDPLCFHQDTLRQLRDIGVRNPRSL